MIILGLFTMMHLIIVLSQLHLCQLWCFVIQLNEDSDSDSDSYSCACLLSWNTLAPSGVCPPGYFNAEAHVSSECVRCFCFGLADDCTSSSQFLSEVLFFFLLLIKCLVMPPKYLRFHPVIRG